jgi:hypothetical protein
MKLCAPALAALLLAVPAAYAKLPPLSPQAQAQADEAKAKAAWTDKVAAYELCKSQDRAVDNYRKTARSANRETKAGASAPACTDPGPYAAASAAAPTPAAQKPVEQSGAHSPSGTATTPPSASSATQAQTQEGKK